MDTSSGAFLTDSLNFTPKAQAVKSKSFRQNYNPTNGATFSGGSHMYFDIGVNRPNQYIDPHQSLLCFQVVNNDASAVLTVDGSIFSVINRMTTYVGGSIVDDINNYNALAATCLDLQMLGCIGTTSGSVHLGTSPATTLNVDKTGLVIPASGVKDFAMPLALNAIIGSGNKQYLPIDDIKTLRLDLTLESVNAAFVSANAGNASNWTIQNPTLYIQYVEIDAEMGSMIKGANSDGLKLSVSSWKGQPYIQNTGRSGDSMIIPAQYASLNTILTIWRDPAQQSVANAYWVSHRVNPFYSATGVSSSVQFKIGSMVAPQTPITSVSEMWNLTQAAFHQQGSITEGSRCNYNNWNTATYSNVATTMGTFALGLNLTTFQNKSSKSTSGINTFGINVNQVNNYPAPQTIPHQEDAFWNFDSILYIKDGTAQLITN